MSATSYNIVILSGDHVGPEVIAEGLRVLDKVEELFPVVKFNRNFHAFGGHAIDTTGVPLPDETLEACKAADAILMGSVGGPKWGTGEVRPEQGILKLRKSLNLYANIRPALFPSESLVSSSPIKEEYCKGTEVIVVRENAGGIYFGEKQEVPKDATEGLAYDRCDYSVDEVERIARVAGQLARTRSPSHKVYSLDKANVLATSRLWRNVVTRIFEKEFPDIELKHQLADSAAMILASRPNTINGILLTDNLFGDILSDEASVIPGSLGLLPSASLCGFPDGKSKIPVGLYEPIHGSAPDISGQGIVNPVAMILSVAMMLRYSFGLEAQAMAIENAVRKALDSTDIGGYGIRTKDLGGSAKTTEMTDGILKALSEKA